MSLFTLSPGDTSIPKIVLCLRQVIQFLQQGAAWPAWTPVLTSSAGTITSYTVNSARYFQIGKQVSYHADIKITNAGTGSGTLSATVPVQGAAYIQTTIGQEVAVSGKFIAGTIGIAGLTTDGVFYDNSTIIATNARVILSGTYEAA